MKNISLALLCSGLFLIICILSILNSEISLLFECISQNIKEYLKQIHKKFTQISVNINKTLYMILKKTRIFYIFHNPRKIIYLIIVLTI